MSSDSVEASGARRRRALALTALALIAIAVAGFAYLRPAEESPLSIPASEVGADDISNYPVAFDFITPSLGWAVMALVGPSSDWQFAVLRTTDGARHWRRQFIGQGQDGSSFAPISVQLFGKTLGFMTLGDQTKLLYRTADGGAHWVTVPLPSLDIGTIQFSDASNGWLSGSTQFGPGRLPLFATNDSGDSWMRLPDPPEDAAGLAFRRATEGWLGSIGSGAPHVFRSNDAGRSWVRHDLPAPAGGSSTPGIDQSSSSARVELLPGKGALVVATTVKCLANFPNCSESSVDVSGFRSDGIADTWRSVAVPPGRVTFQDSTHWWATSDYSLFKSTDGGQSWNSGVYLPWDGTFEGTPGIFDSRHAWSAVSVNDGYGLAFTSDGGLHWNLAKVPEFQWL